MTDSGSASDIDKLFVNVQGATATDTGTQLLYTQERGNVIIDYDNIESLIIQEVIGDATLDGQLSASDIDAVYSAIGEGNTSIQFDINNDGAVDLDDPNKLVQCVFNTEFGDLNLDGRVAFDDFLVLSANFGKDEPGLGWVDGDLDGNKQVNFMDFLKLSANFGFER